MPSRLLPTRPSLAQLKRQAAELRRQHREGSRSAAARVLAHHPQKKGQPLDAELARPLRLADAQLVVAREYGFESWPRLKRHVEISGRLARFRPHPRFDDAVAAIDTGDVDRLREILAADRLLVTARTNLDPPYGYFTAATLLHHVAGNPDRGRLEGRVGPLTERTIEIARLLLEMGADVNAQTLGPDGGDTMGLLITSKQASDAGVTGALIDLLLAHGAMLDLTGPGALDAPLANHAPRAAEKMIALGAPADVCAAAALGRMDLLREAFDAAGRLRVRPRRRGKPMSERDAIGLAMLFAYVNQRSEAVDFLLEKDGNWNMIGVNNGTALHRAAWDGDRPMVERLIAKGADLGDRNNPFTATPLSWAEHNQQIAIVQWMREHCAIDLHDAVSFDLREHVQARLRENPDSVNARLDQWDLPQSTPLHCAAHQNRVELARLLLRHGADPNLLAGNGQTALDVADARRAEAVRSVLEQHGGKRAAEL